MRLPPLGNSKRDSITRKLVTMNISFSDFLARAFVCVCVCVCVCMCVWYSVGVFVSWGPVCWGLFLRQFLLESNHLWGFNFGEIRGFFICGVGEVFGGVCFGRLVLSWRGFMFGGFHFGFYYLRVEHSPSGFICWIFRFRQIPPREFWTHMGGGRSTYRCCPITLFNAVTGRNRDF